MDKIAKIGTVIKLRHMTNGEWLILLDCAQEMVNVPGNSKFHLSVKYMELALVNNNVIELVTDQNPSWLHRQPEPQTQFSGSFFLHKICTQILNIVSFDF